MVTIWWSADYLIHYSFLSPGETIPSEKYAQKINEMHQKLQCLQPAFVNKKGPILLHNNAWLHIAQPILQKLDKLGYEVLPYPLHIHLTSHQVTTISSSILTTFSRQKVPTTSRRQKILSKSLLNSKPMIFMLQEYTNLFLIGKNVLIVEFPILINKDVWQNSLQIKKKKKSSETNKKYV